MDEIKVVELFAGVGGFRLGLETSSERYKIIWANQWEPIDSNQNAFSCYETHFGHSSSNICKDISSVVDEVPEHDLLVGGFPCQDYSVAKSGAKGIEGEKGSLWWQIDKIIRARRPKCVVLENVDRILRSPAKQKGRDFSMILRSFYEAGYMVEWRVINSADYGCAQRRRRTFIVAMRNDTELFKKLATATCISGFMGMRLFLQKDGVLSKAFPVKEVIGAKVETFIDELSFDSMQDIFESMKVYLYNAGVMMNGTVYSEEMSPFRSSSRPLSSIVLSSPVSSSYYLKETDLDKWIYLKGAKSEYRFNAYGQKYLFSEGAMPFPDLLDRPARTILTGEGTISRSTHVICDPSTGKLRTLFPVECERLNGFPDGWTGMLPEKFRYFTMGNALVVPIVTMIGNALKNII